MPFASAGERGEAAGERSRSFSGGGVGDVMLLIDAQISSAIVNSIAFPCAAQKYDHCKNNTVPSETARLRILGAKSKVVFRLCFAA